MKPRHLARRLARLEATRTATDGWYAVHIGDEPYLTWEGQPVLLDEWRRLYPDAVLVDIGGGGDGLIVKPVDHIGIDAL